MVQAPHSQTPLDTTIVYRRGLLDLIWREWRSKLAPADSRKVDGDSLTYRKFLVIGMPRSGTTLVCQLLNSHPEIFSYNEVFSRPGFLIPRFFHLSPRTQQRLLRLRSLDPGLLFRRFVNGPHSESIKAVGFKAMWGHIEEHAFLKNLILQDPQLHLIYIKRENLVSCVLSQLLAQSTKVWNSGSDPWSLDNQFSVPLEDFSRLVRTRGDAHEKCGEQMEVLRTTHQVLELDYDFLCREPSINVRAMTDFLQVPRHPLATLHRKRNARPLSEWIQNYAELRQLVRGSKLEDQLDAAENDYSNQITAKTRIG
jgi:LPS sulfotransferase NodH